MPWGLRGKRASDPLAAFNTYIGATVSFQQSITKCRFFPAALFVSCRNTSIFKAVEPAVGRAGFEPARFLYLRSFHSKWKRNTLRAISVCARILELLMSFSRSTFPVFYTYQFRHLPICEQGRNPALSILKTNTRHPKPETVALAGLEPATFGL